MSENVKVFNLYPVNKEIYHKQLNDLHKKIKLTDYIVIIFNGIYKNEKEKATNILKTKVWSTNYNIWVANKSIEIIKNILNENNISHNYVKQEISKFTKTQSISKKQLKFFGNQNPHVKQNKIAAFTYKFSRIIDNDSTRLSYYRRKNELKSVIHWGQRKLLLVEIEFLTKFSTKGDTVVYAGSAPGNHTPFLSSLFPTLTFMLYDPNDFAIKEQGKIKIFQEYFTDEIALQYTGRDDVLFISDIRTADPASMNSTEVEKRVEIDNMMQKKWYELIRPKKAMLKFRLPWAIMGATKWVTTGGEKFRYLDGDIYIQPWAPQTSTETRLVLGPFYEYEKEAPTVEYDNVAYEERMFYYNTNIRPSLFEHNIKGEGLDKCYDCTAEINILSEYLIKFDSLKLNTDLLHKKVSQMSKYISRLLGGRRLNQPQPPPGHRKFKPSKLIEHKNASNKFRHKQF
jgi:hypothetical protein